MYECKYGILPDGRALVDYGPITMSILAEQDGQAVIEAAVAGAREALRQLDILIPSLSFARCRIPDLSEEMLRDCPEILRRMAQAVRRLDRADFTPMAAVAGTFSELVRDHVLAATKADTVVVNNGGDIALGCRNPDKPWNVGVVSDLNRREVTHRLMIPGGCGSAGLATSGFGGRSLTKGIASAVTVIAEQPSWADAAATDIANATYVEDPHVVRCLAEELEYGTDIPGDLVVKEVGPLSGDAIDRAIGQGLCRARELARTGMIRGAVLFVGGKTACYPAEKTAFELTEI